MKKILLSVIALFAAVSMYAEPYEVKTEAGLFNDPAYTNFDLEKSSGWGGKWFNFAKEGEDSFLNFDASAYDYVWIKFSGNTGKFRFGITYNEWKSTESWGETFYDKMETTEEAEGYLYIPIEKEKKYEFGGPNSEASPYAGDTWDKHIRQIYTQDDGNEVSVKIEGVWFGTTAELEAILGGGETPEPEPTPEPTPEPSGDTWGDVILNGNCDGEDAGCLLSKDGDDMDNIVWQFAEGAGVDGTNCATVFATGAATNEWDAQFFIYAKDHVFKAGEKFQFSMMIKADKEAEADAQAHTTPSNYKHYAIIGGPIKFTTEWTEYKYEGEVPAEADGIQTIALNLNKDKTLENNYYFDNISWKVEGATAIQNVKAAKANDGARYNLAGQKVNASYKGVVIMNGKKYLQK